MNHVKFEEDLFFDLCSSCDGHWIPFFNYQIWLERAQPKNQIPEPDENAVEVASNKHALLCPECSRIMLKYRITHDMEMTLDQCGHCKGIWFDENEWAVLKDRQLHTKLHFLFTAPWQNRIRQERSRLVFERIYQEKFGKETFEELKRIKQWINENPQKNMLLTYLNNDDPYEC